MGLQEANKFFYRVLLKPHSLNKDAIRREFILNVLLIGLSILTTVAFLINLTHPLFYPESEGQSPALTGSISLFLYVLLFMSRAGKSKLSAMIFTWFLTLVGIYMSFYWGADLPASLMFFALLIVMISILLNSKLAFVVTTLLGAAILVFSYMEETGLYQAHTEWKNEVVHMADSVIYVIILALLAIVSWLGNREIEKALRRARASEALVKRQRDNLELLVEKRTSQLRRVESEKLSQLYRFAEFGRMATGLFHDLATPLNLVTLNLDRLQKQNTNITKKKLIDSKQLLSRALIGTKRLEFFIVAARKQLQTKDELSRFDLSFEISQVIQMLEYKARKARVELVIGAPLKLMYYGNPAKFNQLVTNLVSNAIDSYERSGKKNKKVEILMHRINNKALFQVKDWGKGIFEKDLEHIFEPFFTTKSTSTGMGMGLSISRDVVERDFKGKLHVESKVGRGTTFAAVFPLRLKSKS